VLILRPALADLRGPGGDLCGCRVAGQSIIHVAPKRKAAPLARIAPQARGATAARPYDKTIRRDYRQ
jgi:hypothetical protein